MPWVHLNQINDPWCLLHGTQLEEELGCTWYLHTLQGSHVTAVQFRENNSFEIGNLIGTFLIYQRLACCAMWLDGSKTMQDLPVSSLVPVVDDVFFFFSKKF